MEQKIAKAVAVIGVIVAVAACADGVATTALSPSSAQAAKGGPKANDAPEDKKVTICHAAGLAISPKYIRITISVNGLKGHFGNNGTTKAGHELDFIETADRICNAPEPALLVVCKVSDPDKTAGDPDAEFHFTSPEVDPFSLHFKQCTDPMPVVPGNVKITETRDQLAPTAGYFATGFDITGGTHVNDFGFGGPPRPSVAVDAFVEVTTTSGVTTTVTFHNRI